jgi:hypothetical protein
MKLFRDLTEEEKEKFRKWARENYKKIPAHLRADVGKIKD